MRPFDNYIEMHFGYGKTYPDNVAKHVGIKKHTGQDFLTIEGILVKASVNGWWLGFKWYRGYGYTADILFYTGKLWYKKWYVIRFAHLLANSDMRFKYGQYLIKEDIVARTGASGTTYSDGPGHEPRRHPHCHVEVWAAEKIQGAWIKTNIVHPGFVTREEI